MTTERTLDLNKMKEVHKELQSKIYGCKCNPSLEPWMYCKQCQNTVIEFMNNYGAGVLCRDIEVDTLQKELSKTKISLVSIEKKFESKCKDYENLKNKQKQTNQNIIKLREELKKDMTFYGLGDYWVEYTDELFQKHFPQIGNHTLQSEDNVSAGQNPKTIREAGGADSSKSYQEGSMPSSQCGTSEQKKANKGELLPSSSVSEVNFNNNCTAPVKINFSEVQSQDKQEGRIDVKIQNTPTSFTQDNLDSEQRNNCSFRKDNSNSVSEVNNQVGCGKTIRGVFTCGKEGILCKSCKSKQEKKQ